MPVNLSCIPARAKRRKAPSFKRWLIFLVAFIASGGFATAYFWPANVPTHTALFWGYFWGIPILGGGAIMGLRWLVYLAGEWLADGWDNARARDLAQDIYHGQRSLALLSHVVHLPHVISAGPLSRQLLMPDTIRLPIQVDKSGESLIHHASFNSIGSPVQERVKERICLLLTEPSLQSALQRLPAKASLAVLFQFCPDISVSPEEHSGLQQLVREYAGLSINMTFIYGEGLQVVDTWLDNPEMTKYMLTIALNLSQKTTDGTGEVAVALLLNSSETCGSDCGAIAKIHRPEQVKIGQEIEYALLQALYWGNLTPELIKNIWLTGTGMSNEATSLLSSAGVRFPASGQPCDIDLKVGLTENVSPWLALAIAAEEAGLSGVSQVVMSVPNNHACPWFVAVCPLAK